MLALALLSWLSRNRCEDSLSIVSFRGGELAGEFSRFGPLRIMLNDEEAWDHRRPDSPRAAQLMADFFGLEPADITLLVSVSAGQVLPYLPAGRDCVVAWVVEQGEDLHWLHGPLRVADHVDAWIAGSEGTREALLEVLGDQTVAVAAEFVDDWSPSPPGGTSEGARATFRAGLGIGADQMMVLGAGICTYRKAPDLFLETVVAVERSQPGRARFVWLGGERDPLFDKVSAEIERLGVSSMQILPGVAELRPWFDAADVFLHPARLDAFPLVCLHAAITGTPVVAFRGAGGVPEMLGDTFRGANYPDVAGLGAEVVGLIDPHQRARLGGEQQQVVRKRFVTDIAAPALVDAVMVAQHEHRLAS